MNEASDPLHSTHPALRWAKWIGTTLVLSVTLGYLGLILAGYQPMTMVTGSMQKSIPVGSLVVSHSVSPNSLRVGDVISFQKPIGEPGLDTHRIVAIKIENKQRVYQTKGDSNSLIDPWVLRFDPGMEAHRMVFHVRYFGNALLFARSPIGRILLIGYVCFALLFSILKAVEAAKQKKLEEEAAAALSRERPEPAMTAAVVVEEPPAPEPPASAEELAEAPGRAPASLGVALACLALAVVGWGALRRRG